MSSHPNKDKCGSELGIAKKLNTMPIESPSTTFLKKICSIFPPIDHKFKGKAINLDRTVV